MHFPVSPYQHRLLLEVSQAALTGDPAMLGGRNSTRRCGATVAVGIQQMEYGSLALAFVPSSVRNPYASTGAPLSVAAGRLSFTFGLQGPSVAVDTGVAFSVYVWISP